MGAATARVSRNTGLLGRLWRPSVAPSAWSRGGMIDGTATAPMVRRRPPSEPEELLSSRFPRSARFGIVPGALRAGALFRHNAEPRTSQ